MLELVILSFYLEEAAFVMAHRANFRCFFADMDVSAIATDPHCITIA